MQTGVRVPCAEKAVGGEALVGKWKKLAKVSVVGCSSATRWALWWCARCWYDMVFKVRRGVRPSSRCGGEEMQTDASTWEVGSRSMVGVWLASWGSRRPGDREKRLCLMWRWCR